MLSDKFYVNYFSEIAINENGHILPQQTLLNLWGLKKKAAS